MKYEKTAGVVKQLLEEEPSLREAGMEASMYLAVCRRINPIACRLPFEDVMRGRSTYGFPQFETVRRCRQKLQAENESLRSSLISEHIRRDEMSEVLDYVTQ